MNMDAMKAALKNRSKKKYAEGSPQEEAGESPAEERKEQEGLGLAPGADKKPDAGNAKMTQPKAAGSYNAQGVEEDHSKEPGSPMENGDAMRKFAGMIPSQGRSANSLGERVKDKIKKALEAKKG